MAPKRATKRPVVKKTLGGKTATNPVDALVQKRREFFTSLQERLQALPDTAVLPAGVSEDIRAYSRTQVSEKGLIKAVDCNVEQLNKLLEFLLQPPHLEISSLESIVQKFLASLVVEEELGLEGQLSHLSYEERIIHKLRKYVKEHLSAFLIDLPVDAPKTDKKLEDVQKDLQTLFPVDNPFANLFESMIPAFYIKSWLAQTDFHSPRGLDIRYSVHKFIQDHRFHLLKDILDEGFSPKSAHDWELVVGTDFFESYPLAFWKATTWSEIERVNEELKKNSFTVHDYFRLMHDKETAKLIRVKEIKRPGIRRKLEVLEEEEMGGSGEKIMYHGATNLLQMPNENEMSIHLRIRSDLPHFVCHLLAPLQLEDEGVNDYLGEQLKNGLFYPSSQFYKERIYEKTRFENGHLVLTSTSYIKKKTFPFHIYYMFRDGRIIQQTKTLFEQEQTYLKQQKGIQLPKLKQHLLDSPLEYLSLTDVEKIRQKMKGDLSTFFNQVFVEKLNTDAIVKEIDSCFLRCRTLGEYLEKMFKVFLIVHPRYEFHKVFPEMKKRLNLFFYRLPMLGDLPEELLFPRLATLSEEKQQIYRKWCEKNLEDFKQEMIMYLIMEQYRFIRIPIGSISHTAAPANLYDDKMVDYMWLMPWKNVMVDLPEVSSASPEDEILVGGKPLPSKVVEMIEKFVEVERVKMHEVAFLEETGFELVKENIPVETSVINVPTTQPVVLPNLPDFKENAFAYLEELLHA